MAKPASCAPDAGQYCTREAQHLCGGPVQRQGKFCDGCEDSLKQLLKRSYYLDIKDNDERMLSLLAKLMQKYVQRKTSINERC